MAIIISLEGKWDLSREYLMKAVQILNKEHERELTSLKENFKNVLKAHKSS